MKFTPTRLNGLWLIEPEPIEDARGFFLRTYCEKEFKLHFLNTIWPQCNLTYSKQQGMIRGLHYQADPHAEIKLIRCNAGAIFDVVVDLRDDSPTHGKWQGFELTHQNQNQLYVPAGFAHGFQCLTPQCEVYYQMSEFYFPELAKGIRWNDPALQITWPLPDAVLSERDKILPLIASR